MIPAQLLSHFDRVSEVPGAISRLRRFILDLAVRGKLVEQDPRDEPASELLKEIEAEKVCLAKAGKIRKQEPAPQVAIEDQPFELPSNWKWVRFGSIADFSPGRTPSRHDFSFWNTGDYPWVSIADMRDGGVVAATKETISAKAKNQVFRSEPAPVGTVIMSFKLTIGKISRLGIPAFHNEAIISIHPYSQTMEYYLFKVLPQFSLQGNTKDAIKGATLNRDSITNIFLPLPPLAEQHRIVAKVDELMALCDRLEAAQGERESRRDRLVVSSLNRLNNGVDAEAFHDHARFYFNHLPRFTTKSEHIQQLRQTILNLAVRGKLVPQDPHDEPASELLKRIQIEKARLVKAGILTQQKMTAIEPKALAFDCPESWQSVNFVDVCNLVTSGSRGWAEFYSDTGPKFIRAQNIRFGRLRLVDLACVSLPKKTEGTRTQISKGDLLIVITGAGVTNPAMLDHDLGEAYVSQHVALIKPTATSLSRWLLLCLMAPVGARAELVERAYGAGKPGLNLDNIRFLRIPIPPLAEQQRIVAKVDELLALCDRLEAQLTTTTAMRGELLESTIHEAFIASGGN